MKNQFAKFILTAGISALLGSTVAVAQNQKEVADIPFDFHTAQHTLLAGTYTVAQESTTGTFRISDAEGHSVFVGMHPGKDSDPSNPKLTFVRSGDDYVLEGVSMPGYNSGWEQSQSQIDKELSRKIGLAAMISVPLRSR
jgi:hypothetical protein